MNRLRDLQDSVADVFGMRPRSNWDRLRDFDVRDILPIERARDVRDFMPRRRTVDVDYDVPSLVVGLVVGCALGLTLGYLAKGNVRPNVARARRRVQETLSKVEERLPGRLSITRMEEEEAKTP